MVALGADPLKASNKGSKQPSKWYNYLEHHQYYTDTTTWQKLVVIQETIKFTKDWNWFIRMTIYVNSVHLCDSSRKPINYRRNLVRRKSLIHGFGASLLSTATVVPRIHQRWAIKNRHILLPTRTTKQTDPNQTRTVVLIWACCTLAVTVNWLL